MGSDEGKRSVSIVGLAYVFVVYRKVPEFLDVRNFVGRRGGLVVERLTPEREVGGSILTQVAVLYP